jgi:hypothetical protein
MTGLRFDHYDWTNGDGAGGRETMLRFGPDRGPVVIAALPMFEEANRTRQFVVTILRSLADRGIAGLLPDLPGAGESIVATCDARLSHQRRAYAALAGHLGPAVYALSVRSGALHDTAAALRGRWHLAPQTGADVVRDLDRIRHAAAEFDRRDGRQATVDEPHDYAGNALSGEMLCEVGDAVPVNAEHRPLRVVRLEADPRVADIRYPGTPLWRRSEPDNDVPLAHALAEDIFAWIATCEG